MGFLPRVSRTWRLCAKRFLLPVTVFSRKAAKGRKDAKSRNRRQDPQEPDLYIRRQLLPPYSLALALAPCPN